MSQRAPLCVPVEIRRVGGGRWFRLARGVSRLGLELRSALPEACDGPLEIAFHLPEDDLRLAFTARAVEIETGDESSPVERRALRFLGPDEASQDRITRYLTERLGD